MRLARRSRASAGSAALLVAAVALTPGVYAAGSGSYSSRSSSSSSSNSSSGGSSASSTRTRLPSTRNAPQTRSSSASSSSGLRTGASRSAPRARPRRTTSVPGAGPPPPVRDTAALSSSLVGASSRAGRLYEEGRRLSDQGDAAADPAARRQAYAQAVAQFEEALLLEADSAQIWNELGYALRAQGKVDQALNAYDRALDLHPGYGPALEYRAEAYLAKKQLGKVKAAYMQLFREDRRLADHLAAAIRDWLAGYADNQKAQASRAFRAFQDWFRARQEVASRVDWGRDSAKAW